MRQMKRTVLAAGAISLVCAFSAQAATYDISSNFIRSGVSESLTSLFINPSTATVHQYSGLVEIIVSGTGWSAGRELNDAFHGVPRGTPYDSQWYQLNLGWNGADLAPYSGEARNISNYINFIDGVGAVNGGIPAFRTDHRYHFVVNVPQNAGRLQFGVSDGIFADNGGQYNIQAFKVTAIPEAGAYAMLLSGLAALALLSRRRKV
ncbi:PEP-CTERM sorting domain-containing protein [Massilia sp. W12]|uniref:PEP-CTERM sorting domain-containing protein n=1 Tax=Massilia sp. W12 TaxID=3126507 RepID=UPI0030D288FF